MAREADLAGDGGHRHGAGLLHLATAQRCSDLALHNARTAESREEIERPVLAPIFSVGDRAQPDLFLLCDELFDCAVFNLRERGGGELTAAAPCARLGYGRWTQQTADVVGPERSLCHVYILT